MPNPFSKLLTVYHLTKEELSTKLWLSYSLMILSKSLTLRGHHQLSEYAKEGQIVFVTTFEKSTKSQRLISIRFPEAMTFCPSSQVKRSFRFSMPTKVFRTKIAMSSAYHPQTDGQTERMVRTVKEMLRSFVNHRQTNWSEQLAAIEFAYNNDVHSSTQLSPFELDLGYHPRTPYTCLFPEVEVLSSSEFIHHRRHSDHRQQCISHDIIKSLFALSTKSVNLHFMLASMTGKPESSEEAEQRGLAST
jgi:hypothetical protein